MSTTMPEPGVETAFEELGHVIEAELGEQVTAIERPMPEAERRELEDRLESVSHAHAAANARLRSLFAG
jgi:hypothetical protein